MSGAALLLVGLACGLAWAAGLPAGGGRAERLASGGVVGLLVSSWVAWLATLALGYRGATWAAPAALLALAGWALVRGRRRPAGPSDRPAAGPHRRPAPSRGAAPWLLFTGGASSLLVWLFSSHYLPERDGGLASAGSTWGDLALHASLAARFSQQSRFEWTSPLLHGEPLGYPFLPDFLSGVLHRGGLSLRWALLAPSLLLACCLVQLLFAAARRAIGRPGAAAVAGLLVLLDGSALGLVAWWADWRSSQLGLLRFLSALPRDYAHLPEHNLRFSNLVCDGLLPQRGLLAGLAIFLVAALLLQQAWEGVGAGRRRPLCEAGVLLGLLPLVHVHTFLVLAGVLAWLAAAQALAAGRMGGRRRRLLDGGLAAARDWLVALAVAAVLAVPQLAWQLAAADDGFSGWRLGWMSAPGESPLLFWLRNLGVLAPFLVVAPWLLRRWRGFWRQLLAALLALFAIANVYQFQPHDYDNLKLLYYVLLALALLVARQLAEWWQRGGPGRAAALACLLLATASGALSVLREATLSWPFLDREEVALGMALRRLTPADARFLTAERHNHPVPVIAGRPIVLGYRGWLWTHGADTSRHLRDVAAIYRGDPAAPWLLARYGVSYLVVGPAERAAFAIDEGALAGYPVVLASERYRVYRVSGSKRGVSAGSRAAKRAASK